LAEEGRVSTPKQAHREGVMRRFDGRCFYADLEKHPCAGRLQAHHVIPVQRLRHEHSIKAWSRTDHPLLAVTLDELVADPRNGVPLCERHHKAWHDGTRRPLREQLPAEVEAFAAEFWLTFSLDYDFGPAPENPSLFGSAAA
jgi:hypothetical protein